MSDNSTYIKSKQKLFIEPLEQRIMLDGAGASTFLDLIDERNQQFIKTKPNNPENTTENTNSDKEIPFTNIAKDKVRNDKKNVVFIDSAVEDYEIITSSFKENTEFYLINSNEDGFKRINQILKDRQNIDALHLIGHGSAGQILFGNAFLNNETIDSYKSILTSIGQSLTTSGDILFYGCNVASTEQGEILIKKISEITKADIAASDDITGKDGDWDLEKEEGFINVKELEVRHYDHSLGSLSTSGVLSNSGVSHIDNNVTMINSSSSNTHIGLGGVSSRSAPGGLDSTGSDFGLVVERLNVNVSSGKLISQLDLDTDYTNLNKRDGSGSGGNAYLEIGTTGGMDEQYASGNITVNSYIMFLGSQNKNSGGYDRRTSNYSGEVAFDGEIVGIFFDQAYTRGQDINGVTYHDTSSFTYDMDGDGNAETNTYDSDEGRIIEPGKFFGDDTTSVNSGGDWVSVGNYGSGTNNYLRFGCTNSSANTGDYIRILVVPNSSDGSSTVEEDGSVSVSNGGSASSPDPITVDSGSTLSSSSGTPRRMAFSDDGTKLFVLEHGSDTITTHNLGTAYDISTQTSSVTGTTLTSNPHTMAYGIEFSTDGTKMFTSDIKTGYVYQWDLSTAWDVSSATLSTSDNLNTVSLFGVTASNSNYNRDITFSEDGTKLFIIGSDKTAHQISLGTAWDLSSYQTPDIEKDLSSSLTDTYVNSISFSPNGKKMFINGYDKNIFEFSLATAWDLSSTVTTEGSFQLGTEITSNNFGEVVWNKDGSKLFVLDHYAEDITEYSVSTP
ncbi:DUF4347 domain-containing protein, partial [Candidatus Pelagibacter sp.]|nr:DUF4347 domain-containing protein [Candidatus Pelagibacter sp.]